MSGDRKKQDGADLFFGPDTESSHFTASGPSSDGAARKRPRPLANPEAMPPLGYPLREGDGAPLKEEKSPSFQDMKKSSPVSNKEAQKEDVGENAVKKSLDGMYGVYEDPRRAPAKQWKKADLIRYAVLFLCIFGFLSAGTLVFRKLYDYYRSYVVYSGLQEMVKKQDYFAGEYLKKSESCVVSLTPQDILNGKKGAENSVNETFTEEQQNLVNKIRQLKKINPDTAGWIAIQGTVVDYPVVWTKTKNYYLHRDFYGKSLSGGAIYIDERNSANVAENRNTVIYGHNMTDGSMFASLHDFANASVFYSAEIQITTEEGVFVYKPFSAHESNAYDNYFETDFVSDEDFIDFCEQMAFISLYETDLTFDKNSQILTLSTCSKDGSNKDNRFAVHALLIQVIR